jgi:hypothetical protein
LTGGQRLSFFVNCDSRDRCTRLRRQGASRP